ncbi:hypothetical protein PCE1_003446 [Barthelona sp. PCE]
MIFPIRCFTCGKLIANLFMEYEALLKSGVTEKEALERLGIERFCCRRVFLTSVELIDRLLQYHVDTASSNDDPRMEMEPVE